MGNAAELTRALIERVPGQALIEKLLSEWDVGRIRLGATPDEVIIDEEARGWYWGVLGERRVAEVLSSLGREWTVLHSVPIGSGNTDIDHVAIGPSGVFTINTKYSPGAKVWVAGRGLMVNGSSRAVYLRNSMAELERATKLLSDAAGFAVPVYAVVAFVSPHHITVKETPGWDGVGLHVVSDRDLARVLTRRREMSDEQLSRVLDAALRADVWHRSPRPSRPSDHYAKEFDALREALGPRLESTRAARPAPTRSAPAGPARPARGRGPRSSNSMGGRIAAGCISVSAVPILGWVVLNWAAQVLLNR